MSETFVNENARHPHQPIHGTRDDEPNTREAPTNDSSNRPQRVWHHAGQLRWEQRREPANLGAEHHQRSWLEQTRRERLP